MPVYPAIPLILLAGALALPAGAEEPTRQRSMPEDERASQPAVDQRSGMRVYIDPETGEITAQRPPAREAMAPASEALREALSRSDAGLEPVVLPNGEVRLDLRGRFRNVQAARVGADGQWHNRCVDHLHDFEDFVSHDHDETGGER